MKIPRAGIEDPAVNVALDVIEQSVSKEVMPAGIIEAFAGSVIPDGWSLCDGRALSRTNYQQLFATIGTTYGAGDGSTTFNVPDFRGRVLVGEDGAAGRLSANDAMGQSGGIEKHSLAISELPSHDHGGGSHTHNYSRAIAASPNQATPGAGGDFFWTYDGPATGAPNSQVVASQGGGASHQNMPPYQIVNYIIKIV